MSFLICVNGAKPFFYTHLTNQTRVFLAGVIKGFKNIMFIYKACSKKARTFAIKNLLLILQHFEHCSLESRPLYWRYTAHNLPSIAGMLPGTHFLWWCAVLLSHFPESPQWLGNDLYLKWIFFHFINIWIRLRLTIQWYLG